MIRSKKDNSEEFKLLKRKIRLQSYKERITQMIEALKLHKGEGVIESDSKHKV
jgi:hypothetical protein